jgi:hypothetical protein
MADGVDGGRGASRDYPAGVLAVGGAMQCISI